MSPRTRCARQEDWSPLYPRVLPKGGITAEQACAAFEVSVRAGIADIHPHARSCQSNAFSHRRLTLPRRRSGQQPYDDDDATGRPIPIIFEPST